MTSSHPPHHTHHHHTHAHPILFGIGNPLLDISATVPASYLTEHGLIAGSAKLAEEKDLPIYADLEKNHKVEYTAGGATQNSIRVAQWMTGEHGMTTYFGSVGKDHYASQLRQSATSDGVKVEYYEDSEHPTGTCACVIVDKERSLVANLGAANHYKISHLESEVSQKTIHNAKIFYSAGFFLTVSPPSLLLLANHAAQHNKIMSGNLSAPFICQFFYDPLMEAMPFYDILFGNESEAQAWGKTYNTKNAGAIKDESNVKEIAKVLSQLPKKNDKRNRVVVITQGSQPTVVAIKGEVKEYSFTPIESSLIVDLNGAGDAFVGGFLSVLCDANIHLDGNLSDEVLKRATDAGHWASSQIIQVSGIVLKGTGKKF